MARIARVVAPDMPHHITQRGNRRMETFFCDGDYELYRTLLAQWCARWDVVIWAYCLMPNHVHLIAVPKSTAPDGSTSPDGAADGGISAEQRLGRAIGETHRRYTRHINVREQWRGHLWQGRFASFVLDEAHLLTAIRYVELNPVRAGLVARPGDYPWSSARAHLEGKDDALVRVEPLLSEVGDWEGCLAQDLEEEDAARMRRHEGTGRPLGSLSFIERLEAQLERVLQPQKRGPKGPWKHK
jgi:putative transposase